MKNEQVPKWKMISTMAQTFMILVLIAIVVMMMWQINQLQGTARVINYAGIVRGATQREVKLEISGQPNDILIAHLDEIISGLKYEKGTCNLISLDDREYHRCLDIQMEYWETLKNEIAKVRTDGYENTDIVAMSEMYFQLADKTVSAAEIYSEKIAQNIKILEIISAIDMLLLVLVIMQRTMYSIKVARMNKQLEKKAYLDLHTGLPNKSRCEQFFHDEQFINEPTAVMVYDLNNLKLANDTLGHIVGDQLILNFSNLLRGAVPSQDFVGRYGGDEFLVVIHEASAEKIAAINAKMAEAVSRFNKLNHGSDTADVSYACGWALSTDYKQCTFMTLFNQADQNMYENKVSSKKSRRSQEDR